MEQEPIEKIKAMVEVKELSEVLSELDRFESESAKVNFEVGSSDAIKPLPVSERTNEDLVNLHAELHARSCTYGTEALHEAAQEARAEILKRLDCAGMEQDPNWISVEEGTPEMVDGIYPRVLVWDGRRHWTARFWADDGNFHCDECLVIRATHWQPLPEPPGEVIDKMTTES